MIVKRMCKTRKTILVQKCKNPDWLSEINSSVVQLRSLKALNASQMYYITICNNTLRR